METTINDRLRKIIEDKKINPPTLYNKIGTNRSTWSGWLNQGKAIPLDKVIKIVYQIHDLNARWLLTGEGEMLTNEVDKPEPKLSVYQGSNLYRVLENINSQATEPVIDYNVIDPEKAVRQLLAAIASKDFDFQKLNTKYNELNDKYVATLEGMTVKKETANADSLQFRQAANE